MPVPKLSKYDKDFIRDNFKSKSPRSIAKYIEKPSELITEYINKTYGEACSDQDDTESYEICEELRSLPEWRYLKLQYTQDELVLFEQSYITYKHQFKDDVMATERKQILQLLDMEVLLTREKIKAKRTIEDTDRIQRWIDDETDGRRADQIDKDLVERLQAQLDGLRSSTGAYARIQGDYLARHAKILENLKGTRDQRVKEASSNKETVPDLIKAFDNAEFRKKYSREVALMRVATEKIRREFSEYHTFMDNTVDKIFTNCDTV